MKKSAVPLLFSAVKRYYKQVNIRKNFYWVLSSLTVLEVESVINMAGTWKEAGLHGV